MDDYTSQNSERFWSKVDLSRADEEFACWEWAAGQNQRGYGRIMWQNHARGAHRIAYLLAFGEFPPGICVCHHCDNPCCCNPNHLFLGTHNDNMHDMYQKGRRIQVPSYGEKHGKHKLSDAQVADIRERYAQGSVSQDALAKEYDVSQRQIWRIVRLKQRKPSSSA